MRALGSERFGSRRLRRAAVVVCGVAVFALSAAGCGNDASSAGATAGSGGSSTSASASSEVTDGGGTEAAALTSESVLDHLDAEHGNTSGDFDVLTVHPDPLTGCAVDPKVLLDADAVASALDEGKAVATNPDKTVGVVVLHGNTLGTNGTGVPSEVSACVTGIDQMLADL